MITKLKDFIFDNRILFLVYLVLVFFATSSQMNWWVKISFWLFCLFLVWIVGLGENSKSQTNLEFNQWWLLLPLGILIITRLIPFLHYGEAPLGYDTGIYLKHFEDCFSQISLGGCGCRGFVVSFISNLLYLFGWQTGQLLSVFYVILDIFVGLGIYVVAKEYFNKNIAFFSFLIFSLSASQFLAYWWFYWRMAVAMVLTLAAFYLLKKKSWLIIPVAGFTGAVHPLSFLPFGLAMVLYFIFGKERKFTFLSGIGIFLVACSISWKTFLAYLPWYTEKFGLITGYLPYKAQELTGQFVNFDLYRGLILFYLPFAILGLVKLFKQRKFNYLFFYFLVNFLMIYFHLFFHNRFIILLDLAAIVLAGAILSEFVNRFWFRKLGKIAIVLLFLGAGFNIFDQSWQTKPLVSQDELNEIRSLANTEENAFVMAVTSYYSPWIYGYSQRRTIAPGLFEYNKWNLEKWQAFWFSSDLKLRHQLLDEYEKPLYIFTGDRAGRMDFSDDPRFTRVSKRIWKFNR